MRLTMAYQSLYKEFTFLWCFQFDKQLSKKFNPDLPMP